MLLLSIALLVGFAAALKEGDRCSINGQNGTCLVRSSCVEYPQMKALGVRPNICAYRETSREPIICCPARDETVYRSLRKSEQYCHQYRKLASTEISFAALIPDELATLQLVPECDSSIGLILGGLEITPGEFPHIAVLGWRSAVDENPEFSSGGSLISDRYVLTAGHCVRTASNVPNVVRLGDHHLYSTADGLEAITVGIERFHVHPDYKPSKSRYNDIALVQLDHVVTFSTTIRPACLWPSMELNVTRAVAVGYGATELYGTQSDVPMKVGLDILANDRCSEMYTGERKLPVAIANSQLCAWDSGAGGKDTCRGDSGGPLQIALPGHRCLYYVAGITSFGRACGALNSAGVYTRVAAYLDWIESVVWP